MRKSIFFLALLLVFILVGCNNDKVTKDIDIKIYINPGIDTLDLGQEWIDAGAYLLLDGTQMEVTASGTVNSEVTGLYLITYSTTLDGEEYTATRYVMVEDQTPPILMLNIGIDTIIVNDTWNDAGAMAIDNSGEILVIIVTGDVDETTVGSYTITYTATDSSGNSNSIKRIVNVID